jgi:outer membrane protein
VKRLILGSLIGVALATPGHAETLADALVMAKQGNVSIAMAADAAAAARAERTAVERLRLPTLEADAAWSRLAHSPMLDMQTPQGRLQSPAIFRDDQMKTAGATLVLPLYTSGKLSSAIAASRAQADAADALAAGTTLDIQLAVVTAYLDVLRARAAVGVAENRVRALAAHARVVDALYEHQGVPKTDRLAVEVVLENAQADAQQAQNRVRTVEAYYNDLLGQPLDRVPDLAEPNADTAIGRGDLAVLTAEAWDRRPELKALEAERDAMTENAKMLRAETLPQFALRAGWQHVDTQILDRSDIASVGVGFEWKVFDSGQSAARVSAMNFRARAKQREWEETRNSIRREVGDALRGLSDAQARWAAGVRATAASEENLKLATRLYETGLASNAVVLDASAADAEAHLREATARYDVALSDYRIRHALGRL